MKRSGREKKRLWKEAVAKRSGGGQTEAVGGWRKVAAVMEKEAVVNRSGGERKRW